MNRVELLAPAGSFEALQAAVQNGCDAVYIGGTMFGARAFANNFDEEEMKQAVAYAHVYGVRVFVTVNTLIKEDELEACLQYIKKLQDADVDALIIQDLGLFTRIHIHFPDMELHASTQMHVHNPQGIALLKEIGATRVVLPRETSIEQIKEYSKERVDLEVFVQGALCISYSGQCLMSSLTLQRSGNRGECAQSCRMQYDLEKTDEKGTHLLKTDGKYLLSPKDLNSLAHVPELIEAGIASFKIEGRMKRPEYVALMVRCYRKAINAYYEGKDFHVDNTMEEEMQKIFHRGFTGGHLFHDMGKRLVNYERPNHVGIEIGTVIGYHGDKVEIQLHKELYQGDGIRILSTKQDKGFTINRIYKKGLLVNHGDAFDKIEIDKTFYAEKGSKVLKTSDSKQLKQLQTTYMGMQRKISIYGSFHMIKGENAILEVVDQDGNHCKIQSESQCVQARTSPLVQERIDAQLRKSKDTPFDFISIDYDMDEDGILAIREVNQMRRDVLLHLEEKRKTRYAGRRIIEQNSSDKVQMQSIPNVICVVHTLEQYKACKDAKIEMIFVEGEALYQNLMKDDHVYRRTSRVMKSQYPKGIHMIQEIGGLQHKEPVICDTSLNVMNHEHAHVLFTRNAIGVNLSLELSYDECCNIVNAYHDAYGNWGNFIYPLYGREELMLSEYCAINTVEKDSDKKDCGLCKHAQYHFIDLNKHAFPILCDEFCRMHILNEIPRNRSHDIRNALQQHISSFLCIFTKEDEKECKEILSTIHKEVKYAE